MSKKILFFAATCAFLELYDFTIYTVLISLLAPLFFPFTDPKTNILIGYLTVAIAFLFCPLGSLYWGWLGDKYGRVHMLKKSMIFMAVPSLGIALLPTYHEIGIAATIVLFLLRIFQNFSLSGGSLGSTILALENSGKSIGFISGIIVFSGGMGVFFALISGYIVIKFPEYDKLWRLPFLIGSLMMIIRIIITRNIFQSHIVPATSVKFSELMPMIMKHKNAAILVFTFGAIVTAVAYTMTSFFHSYFITLGYDPAVSYLYVAISIVITGITALIAGIIVDKFSSARKVYLLSLWLLITLIIPIFMLIYSGNILYAAVATIMLGIIHGINCVACNILMYQVFPEETRCRGVTLCYATGTSIFGGFSAFILEKASAHHMLLPSIIVLIFACIILYVSHRYENNLLQNKI